jgi:solute carrier family 39 (zinc transporter), member 9
MIFFSIQLDSHEHSESHHAHKRSLLELSIQKRDEFHNPPKIQELDLEAKIEKHEASRTSHSSIGFTLVIGFVFMLVVDQIGGNLAHSHSPSSSILDTQSIRNKITFSTTLGLVIHAGVDGLALGAAASSTKSDIKMIVFIAIMLHKAPASFGLVSFLLHEGLDRIRARRHLIIFALAAPIMAILTYLVLNLPNQQAIVSLNHTGLCMLFSAGTFLYVSTVHVLPEIQSRRDGKQFTLSEMCVFIFGAILPVILSIGHSH